jgi:hypothetical protein
VQRIRALRIRGWHRLISAATPYIRKMTDSNHGEGEKMGSVTRRDGNAAPALGTATALGLGAAAAMAVQKGIAMKNKLRNSQVR